MQPIDSVTQPTPEEFQPQRAIAETHLMSFLNRVFLPVPSDLLDLSEKRIVMMPSCFTESSYINCLFFPEEKIPIYTSSRKCSRFSPLFSKPKKTKEGLLFVLSPKEKEELNRTPQKNKLK